MKRVATAVVLAPLMIASLALPNWLFALVLGAITIAALHEYLKICSAIGLRPFGRTVFLIAALWFLTNSLWFAYGSWSAYHGFHPVLIWWTMFPVNGMNTVAGVSVAVFLALALGREDFREGAESAFASAAAFGYVLLPIWSFFLLRLGNGVLVVIFVFLVVWSGDIAAYYFGRTFGTRKVAPRVSPNKTWEGCIASLVVGALLGTVWLMNIDGIGAWLAERTPIALTSLSPHFGFKMLGSAGRSLTVPLFVLVALAVNIAAQFGDLVESMLKRAADMKDSGTLLPGHGGVLDRIDALLFAAPTTLILVELLK